jgi:CheY-like chemotaxis protein
MLTTTPAHKVVIVNGSVKLLELFEAVLGAGRYDVVFVESSAHAYSRIKRVHPNLLVLCLQMDHTEDFQVLSMLQLDDETKAIPVLTCTHDDDGRDTAHDSPELGDAQSLDVASAEWMN